MQTIYEWDSALETGNKEIDAQHKSLFAALNNLIESYNQGKGLKEIQKTVSFLVEYILKHFADEEKLQQECCYPYIEEHKNSHADLRHKVSVLIKELDVEGYSNAFVEKTIQLMADWLTNHIKGDDFKLAAYIRIKDSLK